MLLSPVLFDWDLLNLKFPLFVGSYSLLSSRSVFLFTGSATRLVSQGGYEQACEKLLYFLKTLRNRV